ncbi:MAG: hypothetical protein J5679_03225 [Alphaproteobacteria bacterium]|nr:hypothetical protein [Alphaproteobacteria bacterium]
MVFIINDTLAEDKNLQAEEKFFADLDKQFKQSKWISCEVRATCEIYHLDKINVSFDIRKMELVIIDKIGFETKMMNCKSDPKSATQQKRFDLFCELLSLARSKNYAENERLEQQQLHDKKSCEVEHIRKELGAVKQIKRQRLGIRAIMRQSVMRGFKGRGL